MSLLTVWIVVFPFLGYWIFGIWDIYLLGCIGGWLTPYDIEIVFAFMSNKLFAHRYVVINGADWSVESKSVISEKNHG